MPIRMSDKKLAGKVAVITGASKGLGRAMALALGGAGARLALVSRDRQQLKATAEAAHALGAEAKIFQTDVTQEEEGKRLEKEVINGLGHVQILINNACIN